MIFIIPQPRKARMPQVTVGCPLGEFCLNAIVNLRPHLDQFVAEAFLRRDLDRVIVVQLQGVQPRCHRGADNQHRRTPSRHFVHRKVPGQQDHTDSHKHKT